MYARLVISSCVCAAIIGMATANAPGCPTVARISELQMIASAVLQVNPYLTKNFQLAAEVCIIQTSFQTLWMSTAGTGSVGRFTAAAKNTRSISCNNPADSVTESNEKLKGPLTCFTWNEGSDKPLSTQGRIFRFVFEAYSNGVIQTAGSTVAAISLGAWNLKVSPCSVPCGGCGIQLKIEIGTGPPFRYSNCGIRQCVRGSDPATFRYRSVKKDGRMVLIAREMQCCYNFKDGQAVERTNPKPCRFRKINGWVAENQIPITRPSTAFELLPAYAFKYVHPLGYTRVFPLNENI